MHAAHVAPGAAAAAMHIERLLLHPFRRFAATARLSVDTLEGSAVGLYIGQIGDAALEHPAALEIPALLEPLENLRAQDASGRVVVLLDGLDELRVRDAPADVGRWLDEHAELHPNLRLVIASRADGDRLEALCEIHKDSLRLVDATTGADAAVHDYAARIAGKEHVREVLRAHGMRPERFAHRAATQAAGIFQYVSFLDRRLAAAAVEGTAAADFDWLREADGEPERPWPNGIGGLYAQFMLRIKGQVERVTATRGAWERVYRPLLGLLAVAHAPLTAAQIAMFAGIGAPGGVAASCETALARLGQFLDGDPARGYFPFHRSVSDYILDPGASYSLRWDEQATHDEITRQAIARHQADGSWKAADPYLRVFLAAHAAAAGLLDDLVEEPSFLVAADPTELLATLENTGRAAAIAALYRLTAADLTARDEATALAHLDLYAREVGQHEFAARVAAMPGRRPWTTCWTNRARGSSRGVIGRHEGGISAIAVARGRGQQPLVLTGGPDGEVRVWDPRRGAAAGPALVPAEGTRSEITSLATGELRTGEAFAAAGSWDGMVRAWNVATRQPLCAPLAGAENAGLRRRRRPGRQRHRDRVAGRGLPGPGQHPGLGPHWRHAARAADPGPGPRQRGGRAGARPGAGGPVHRPRRILADGAGLGCQHRPARGPAAAPAGGLDRGAGPRRRRRRPGHRRRRHGTGGYRSSTR